MKPTIFLGRCAAVFAVLVLLASPAAAQGFKWWNSDQYRREMGLTQEQSRRLEEIFQTALPALRLQKKALDDAEQQFERLMLTERTDESLVMDQIDEVEVARSALSKSRAMMLFRMRKILTSDQWVKLGALHQAAEREKAAQHPNSK
jgi:Spy/CpxP family protein refolding chaperone